MSILNVIYLQKYDNNDTQIVIHHADDLVTFIRDPSLVGWRDGGGEGGWGKARNVLPVHGDPINGAA